jgi:hypothetical protein
MCTCALFVSDPNVNVANRTQTILELVLERTQPRAHARASHSGGLMWVPSTAMGSAHGRALGRFGKRSERCVAGNAYAMAGVPVLSRARGGGAAWRCWSQIPQGQSACRALPPWWRASSARWMEPRCERRGVVRANGRDARLEAGGDPGPERLIRRGQFHKERRMVRRSHDGVPGFAKITLIKLAS